MIRIRLAAGGVCWLQRMARGIRGYDEIDVVAGPKALNLTIEASQLLVDVLLSGPSPFLGLRATVRPCSARRRTPSR